MQKKTLLVAVAGLALSACSANGTSPKGVTTANVAANVMQFAAGTANLYGTSTGLNVVATYRQPHGGQFPGNSGALVTSPTLTVPGTLPATAGAATGFDPTSSIESGPGTADAGTHTMTATSQAFGATALTTFGQSGGVFALGIEPFNALGAADDAGNPNTIGLPFQVAPYPVPLFDTVTAPDVNAFVPWGGPPAFNIAGSGNVSPVGNGLYPPGTAGVSLGLDVFANVAPAAGAYSLSVAIPANTGTVTQSASFTMPSAQVVLGTATAPAFTPDGNGGGTFAFTMPTGATEAYVQITDFGPIEGATPSNNCNGESVVSNGALSQTPVYYTIETTATGTLTLGDALGPAAAPSICTAAQNTTANKGTATSGDQFVVQVIGFDYPAFESSLPNSLGNPSPAIVGANNEDDLTVSTAVCSVEATAGAGLTTCATNPNPLAHARHAAQSIHVLRAPSIRH